MSGQRLHLDEYLPAAGAKPRPAVIFIHGGGFRAGDRGAFAPGEPAFSPTGLTLARHGLAVFAIDYRLEPPARFPGAIGDVIAAVRWIRRHARSLGVDPARIGAFGASAGGNLAAILATRGSGALDRAARVRAAVSWSGPMDLRTFVLGHGFIEGYVGCAPSTCPARYRTASPVANVDATDAPLLLATGTREIVPLAQAQAMAARLAAAGVPHRLVAVPGPRHAAEYLSAVLGPTIAFLERYLFTGP